MNKTALNSLHHQAGARMVDFGGWEMPVHYGSQIKEHHAVRRDCGMFDVSHMCTIDIDGTDAKPFLRRLLANNVDRLQVPGKALYSTLLNTNGGIIDDLIVYFINDNHFRLVVNACTAEKDLHWMTLQQRSWEMNCALHERRTGAAALAMIAVQGPNAKNKVWQALPQIRGATENLPPFHSVKVDNYFIATTGYTGETGFEIAAPTSIAETLWHTFTTVGITPCGLGARDTLRLEAGMNLYGQEMDESISPLDAALAWTIDLDAERNFVGKAALLAQGQTQQLLGLVLLDQGILRSHQEIRTDQGGGIITSGSFSPSLQRSIALARLPLKVRVGDTVTVNIRGKHHPAKVVKPPFIRHGKILLNL